MDEKMRVMSEKPLNAETPNAALHTWITDNDVFFKRNQGQIMETPVSLKDWRLSVEGLVIKNLLKAFLWTTSTVCFKKAKTPSPVKWLKRLRSIPSSSNPKRIKYFPPASYRSEVPPEMVKILIQTPTEFHPIFVPFF